MITSKRAFRIITTVAALSLPCAVVEAQTTNWYAELSGPAESPGTGFGRFSYNAQSHLFTIDVSFSGLLGVTTVSHIHCCTALPFQGTAGVAITPVTLPGFPVGVTSGSYMNAIIDLTLASSFVPGFLSAYGGTTASAEAALIAGINSEQAYFNIHTSEYAGGEIRGFLVVVPEPSSVILTAAGLLGLGVVARQRRRTA